MGRKGYRGHRFSTATVCGRRGQGKNCRNFNCFSPWSIVWCWFGLRKANVENHVDRDSVEEDPQYDQESMDCMHGGSSSAQEGSGKDGKDVSFNLGVGFGIICLIAASKCELNKMVGLCKQMETLIQDFKMELQNPQQDSISKPSESNITISCSTNKAQEQTEHPYSSDIENSDGISSCGQNKNCIIDTKAKNINMDQLEAELEAELEHLQVHLDTEVMTSCQDTEIVGEDSAPEESISIVSFGEVFAPSETTIHMENNGVSPIELERKLHELLAMRQQERIKALESALESAVQKLHENERELSWWKDTTKLVFKHISRRCDSVREHTFNF